MSNEADELAKSLRILAVSLSGDRMTSVVIKNEAPTGFVDEKSCITATTAVIPKELRGDKEIVQRLLEGLIVHEVGHIVKSYPIHKAWKRFINMQTHPGLANEVRCILEDKRVNYFMEGRYKWDVGRRMKQLLKTIQETMLPGYEASSITEMKPVQVAIAAVAYAGLYDGNQEDLYEIAEKKWKCTVDKVLREKVDATIKMMKEDVPYAVTDKQVIALAQKFYDKFLEEAIMASCDKGIGDGLPEWMGGKIESTTGGTIIAIVKEMHKGDEDEEGEDDGDEEDEGDLQIQGGTAAGGGSGLMIETPVPNEPVFNQLVERNMPIIQEMLKKFKLEQTPILKKQSLQRQGRLMTEVLGKAYASSMKRPVENIFERKILQMEKKRMKIGLIVDMSGSMDEEIAKDILTIIAEVSGRKLDDEDFSVLVFGSDFQRIKAFIEPWHNTKARIGNVKCLGGTCLAPPLEAMEKMLKSIPDDCQKMVVIASDFYISDTEQCQEIIRRMTKNNVAVMGVGLCGGEIATVRAFCGELSTYVQSPRLLPELFFEIYRKICGYRIGRARKLKMGS